MRYSIRLADPGFTFTASHAIRFASGETEPVHEHRFRAVLEIAGPLNGSGYVVDFLAASTLLRGTLARYEGMVFQPDATTTPTAERLAAGLLEEFCAAAVKEGLFARSPEEYRVALELEESPGCWALAESNG